MHRNLVEATHTFFTNLRPQTAYVCSDEISLVFAENVMTSIPFAGRVQKLASVASSQYTIEFHNKMLQSLPEYESHRNYQDIKRVLTKGVCFDARVFSLESHEMVLQNILWRSRYDCVRNSKNSLGQTHFNPKSLMGVNSEQVVLKLKQEKGIDWEQQPNEYKFGSFVKKIKFYKDAVDQKTNMPVRVERSKLESFSFLLNLDEKSQQFLMSEFYEE